MRNIIQVLGLMALILATPIIAYAAWNKNFSWPPSFRGWGHPATGGVLHSHNDFLFNADKYHTYNGNENRGHAGIDFALPKDTAIKAIGEGRVVHVSSSGTFNSVVIVEHRTDDRYGNKFCAIYGHISPSVSKGDWMSRGETLGLIMSGSDVGRYWEPHLHFGINTEDDGKVCRGETFATPQGPVGWGRVPLSSQPKDFGFEDPLHFLNNHKNAQGR